MLLDYVQLESCCQHRHSPGCPFCQAQRSLLVPTRGGIVVSHSQSIHREQLELTVSSVISG